MKEKFHNYILENLNSHIKTHSLFSNCELINEKMLLQIKNMFYMNFGFFVRYLNSNTKFESKIFDD